MLIFLPSYFNNYPTINTDKNIADTEDIIRQDPSNKVENIVDKVKDFADKMEDIADKMEDKDDIPNSHRDSPNMDANAPNMDTKSTTGLDTPNT